MLMNIGLIPDLVPEAHLFKDFPTCIALLEKGEVNANPEKSEGIIWKNS